MNKKQRILFVDDQPALLDLLRRTLRSNEHAWDMEFVEGGPAALEALKLAPFDVIVSDLRMPDMSGWQLLEEVRLRYPRTIRILLSGAGDPKEIADPRGTAHQVLCKPCEPRILKAAINREYTLRELLPANAQLKGLVSRLTTMPSLPTTYFRLIDELRSPDPSITRVADLISQDVGMSCTLLRLVNSSFVGLPQRITTPAHAANLLGLILITRLALSAGIFSQFDQTKIEAFSLTELTEHCLSVSAAAERLSEHVNPGDVKASQAALLAGLLHDTGKLLFVENLPEEYRQTLELARREQIPVWEAELKHFGVTHAEIGGCLLGLWGLPEAVVDAVAYHHRPRNCAHRQFNALSCVHIANVLENELRPEDDIFHGRTIDETYLEGLGRTVELELWRDVVRTSRFNGVAV